MPFTTPNLSDLNDQAVASIEAELPGSDAKLRRSNLNVLARVMAGFSHGFYGYLRRFLEECLPWNKGFLLEMWAGIWGLQRKAAVSSWGMAVFTGTNGTPIPLGTQLQTDSGLLYRTQADGLIVSGVALVQIAADVPGAGGNLAAATTLSLVNPVGGIVGTAVVDASGVTNGSDAESDDDLYNRFLQRVRSPAHGGSAQDYVTWTLEVPGVTRAWSVPAFNGIGSVLVLFVRDADVSIFPNAAAVANVQAHIDAVRPVTADVMVGAPVTKTVNFRIHLSPDTAAIRAAVTTSLIDLFTREAAPGAALLLSHANRDVSLSIGEVDHSIISPSANITCAANEMAVLGTIDWV